MADSSESVTERRSNARPPSTPVTGSTYVGTHGGGVYRPSFLQGPGIFSISLGAVLLLFLAGLLVADRTLSNASRTQAEADAWEVAAELENFVAQRALYLRGFRSLFINKSRVVESQFTAMVDELGSPATGMQSLWIADSTGRITYDTALAATVNPSFIPGERTVLMERARQTRRAQLGRPHGTDARGRTVALVEPLLLEDHIVGFAGGMLLASALPLNMRGEHQATRVGVALIAANDTVVANGSLVRGPIERLANRPVSGIPLWRVVVAHSEPSRYVRFALWSL